MADPLTQVSSRAQGFGDPLRCRPCTRQHRDQKRQDKKDREKERETRGQQPPQGGMYILAFLLPVLALGGAPPPQSQPAHSPPRRPRVGDNFHRWPEHVSLTPHFNTPHVSVQELCVQVLLSTCAKENHARADSFV